MNLSRHTAEHWIARASKWFSVRRGVASLVIGLALLGNWSRATAAPPAAANESPRVPSIEFPSGASWLNTAEPLALEKLRGKIVLFDFWTLCCINCMHILPQLDRLEKKYPNQLVVIGVHTPKFDNEREAESIRKAILRYEISHPVFIDADRRFWQAYEVFSWPTVFLIDPEGYVVFRKAHEQVYDDVDAKISQLIRLHRAKRTLNEKPLQFQLARLKEKGDTPLFFPGKVLADAASKRLFIADSTHHRVVITTLDGKKIAIAGRGTAGADDGPFARATFNDPQGLALTGETLYVADRRNHLIRALDLKAQTVTTVAGSGAQGLDRNYNLPPRRVRLNSPWDLLIKGKTLYIAMAGDHQIWTLDLQRQRLAAFAGTGNEEIKDGPRGKAHFAQPSGLATDGRLLYVADSEVSAIRTLPIDGLGEVKTLVGKGLFDFGDFDGEFERARLQHALGVVYHDGLLYVADTYNSKIKTLDPAKRTCTTFLGGDAGGNASDPLFNAPGGLSYADGKLYVADTNSHRIRVVDLKTKAVSTLPISDVAAPKLAAR